MTKIRDKDIAEVKALLSVVCNPTVVTSATVIPVVQEHESIYDLARAATYWIPALLAEREELKAENNRLNESIDAEIDLVNSWTEACRTLEEENRRLKQGQAEKVAALKAKVCGLSSLSRITIPLHATMRLINEYLGESGVIHEEG